MTEMNYEPLKLSKYYIISKKYPYNIRDKTTKELIKPIVDKSTGYYIIHIPNVKEFLLHRIIANQWIENDNPLEKTQVDHINRDPRDNHIDNLRWVSPSENLKNRTKWGDYKYEYKDKLSQDAKTIDVYGKHKFKDLYYDDNELYTNNGVAYRKLAKLKDVKTHKDKEYCYEYVYVYDDEGNERKIYLNKLLKLLIKMARQK